MTRAADMHLNEFFQVDSSADDSRIYKVIKTTCKKKGMLGRACYYFDGLMWQKTISSETIELSPNSPVRPMTMLVSFVPRRKQGDRQ